MTPQTAKLLQSKVSSKIKNALATIAILAISIPIVAQCLPKIKKKPLSLKIIDLVFGIVIVGAFVGLILSILRVI